MQYDIIIIGAGPGGIFSAYELLKSKPELKIGVFEAGAPLNKRKCPIDGKNIKSCIHCKSCAIMNGFGGAGAFSDGKYNITNEFGGNLYEYVGEQEAIDLMEYVDEINCKMGGEKTRLYANSDAAIAKKCLQNDLHLLKAKVRHLGTDINYVVLENLYNELKDKAEFHFFKHIDMVNKIEDGYEVVCGDETYTSTQCIISTGRSGSKWMESVCSNLGIETKSDRNRTVKNAQRALDFCGEVYVARGVDDLEAVFLAVLLPEARGSCSGDGYAALLLLNHPVHDG